MAGRYLEGEQDKGLVIGAKLAQRLETGLGKRLVLMSQDPDNEIADRGFRVVGIFKSKLEAAEEASVFASRSVVQQMLGINGRISEIAVMGSDYRDVEALLGQLTAAAGPALEVLPWHQLDAYAGTMLSVMDGFVLVWIVVIFLALSFGLVNTLVMAVFERVREIGLMLALGMRPGLYPLPDIAGIPVPDYPGSAAGGCAGLAYHTAIGRRYRYFGGRRGHGDVWCRQYAIPRPQMG